MPKVGKSISLKYFANKDIKPKTISWNGEFVEAFPLAASVIYGRSASTIKVEKDGIPILVSPDLEQLKSKEIKDFTDKFSSRVIDIVAKEVALFGDIFKLAGIANRLQTYDHNIFSYITNFTILSLVDGVSPFLGEGENEKKEGVLKHNFQYVADAVRGVVEHGRVTGVTIFDWMFGDGKEKIGKIIFEYFERKNIGSKKDNKKIISEVLNLFDEILIRKIYSNIVL